MMLAGRAAVVFLLMLERAFTTLVQSECLPDLRKMRANTGITSKRVVFFIIYAP